MNFQVKCILTYENVIKNVHMQHLEIKKNILHCFVNQTELLREDTESQM